jgi:hypothetical protein
MQDEMRDESKQNRTGEKNGATMEIRGLGHVNLLLNSGKMADKVKC